MKRLARWLFNMLLVLIGAPASFAASFTPLQFSELVGQSAVVIEGVVVDLRVISIGHVQQQTPRKRAVPPKSPSEDIVEPTDQNMDADVPLPAPQSVGVEDGKMLLTEVTMEVTKEIVGVVGPTVTFRIAGGDDGQVSVTVFGMPKFEIGKRYVVFLRPNFEANAVPITGVNQGAFEVMPDVETGEEILLNADGDIVLDIENDRVVVRHNPERAAGPSPKLAPLPVPDASDDVDVRVSPEVTRYWLSQEAPMSPDDFIDTIIEKIE